MKRIYKKAYCLLLKMIPKKRHDDFIVLTVKALKGTDLLTYAYNNIGILKWENEEISGEKFVIAKILKMKLFEKNGNVFFDVGANIGNYSKTLSAFFPKSQIFAFEPNPNTFKTLQKNSKGNNIKIFQFGFGSQNMHEKMYTYKDDPQSEHASIFKEYKNVINEVLAKKETLSFDIEIRTIDSFCEEMGIEHIDFIKIDTEGYEYEVIKGSGKLLKENKIGIIQFEFNVANILSRTFLKDFYDLLSTQYNFYRVDTERLISLGSYDSTNEIFKFQNILVINKTLE
jgi:FkbM family methyltransferase